ncbi:MAG: methyltransferase [Candidatus Aminicenantes bacterium]|nr:methyltransferase [Candidatus Aminicenantes bacterium]NIM84638.1 methyltransferase [Candidatus Aminicenantes bacterium]NIN24143.1 methyltransferase [Candidatus Aminicenantes bacterium]NIN47867.1 methyltransferase [Candidatus Aminicenantes bacterium]NIN90805.1 methyltransferase [Candidatus Aminicenantes bacterium]
MKSMFPGKTESNAEKEPYYQTELGKLYNLDVLEFFKILPSQSVHLIFADPPYNIKKAEWDSFESQKKYIEWSLKWIEEAERVLHPTGSLYICGFSEILADIKWSASHLFRGCKWLVWYYRNKANLGNDWGRSHESLLHFRKSRTFILNIDKIRVPYNAHTLRYPTRPQAKSSQYSHANSKKEYIWTPNPAGAKPKDVFELPTLSNHSWEKTSHPTQKPIELVKKVILASSNENSLIVDPFGGSGTTFAVAEAFKRRWLGTELNPDYCEMIKTRLLDREQIERIANGKDEEEAIKRRKKIREASSC